MYKSVESFACRNLALTSCVFGWVNVSSDLAKSPAFIRSGNVYV